MVIGLPVCPFFCHIEPQSHDDLFQRNPVSTTETVPAQARLHPEQLMHIQTIAAWKRQSTNRLSFLETYREVWHFLIHQHVFAIFAW